MDGSGLASARARLLLVELNEFDPAFLREASERLGLRNIPILLGLRHSRTTTDDAIEHQGLDPWVQWVNVHTGKPSPIHKVKRLGDTRGQKVPPIWTTLGASGRTWGVWGAMNAPCGPIDNAKFFFPDPWSFDEVAFPADLNDILDLPRYMSKNYLQFDKGIAVAKGLRLAGALAHPSAWPTSARFSYRLLTNMMRIAPSVHGSASYLDYLSACFFLQLRRKHRPDFSLIFLNLIAHLQHQFWSLDETIHPEMQLGLRLTDRILGDLYNDLQPGEAIILMNGLKQKNVAGQGFHVYRQKDPELVLKWLELDYDRVEQCMTHDAQILFATQAQADQAVRRLDACRLADGNKAFYVEQLEPLRVFYQLNFEHRVDTDSHLLCGNRKIRFGDLIDLYAVRTGAHIPDADIYSSGIDLPAKLYNHEVARLILEYFGVDSGLAAEKTIMART